MRRGAQVPGTVGWLPEDPDDPPKGSWRDVPLIILGVALLTGVHEAIPDGWAFWKTCAVYAAIGLGIVAALRLWVRWSIRRTAASSAGRE
jgi:hypothetical protein